jgi:hypothetical protein
MTPQSDLLGKLSPQSINPKNRLVMTKPTLQIADDAFPNIFTAGDVADLEEVKVSLTLAPSVMYDRRRSEEKKKKRNSEQPFLFIFNFLDWRTGVATGYHLH